MMGVGRGFRQQTELAAGEGLHIAVEEGGPGLGGPFCYISFGA